LVGYIIQKLLLVLSYLQIEGYSHRDIKPDNILIARNTFEVVLSDFDLAGTITERIYCGTPGYIAPELKKENEQNGVLETEQGKSDIFSVGVVAFFLLFGKLPFNLGKTEEKSLIIKE
jgi:serine/threonine protein kinase